MRTKKRPTVATANITDAWAKVFEEAKTDDIEQLHRDGWRNIYDVAEQSGRDRQTILRKLEAEVIAGRFEKKSARVKRSTQVRQMFFYRPK